MSEVGNANVNEDTEEPCVKDMHHPHQEDAQLGGQVA